MSCSARYILLCLSIFCGGSLALAQAPDHSFHGTINLAVDASEAPEKLFHATLAIPVAPGPITLLYPEWIPGEHGPTGPIADLTGLKFTAGGQTLAWRRDEANMYAIHLTVPDGASELQAVLDYTSPAELRGGFSAGSTASAQMAVLNWNWMLLYPQGFPAEQITYRATLRLPSGWKFGTALPLANGSSDTLEFQPVSLYTLVDSPVIAGRYFRLLPLTLPGSWPPAEMDIAADSAAALQMGPQWEHHLKQLVAEATTLFGATHYRDYHFLFSLSDHVASFGLEHHESNDSRTRERSLIDPQLGLLMGGLLPHEYTHSWNGKYRRPAGLNTPDYSEAMKGDLLWVYEGLTDYLGNVLSARSGIRTAEQYRDELAEIAASMEYRTGRSWRPLIDTAVAAQVLYEAPESWSNWRRSVDYYPEGDLIWLDADTTIRELTKGKKSLDDFCKLFEGPPSLGRDQVPAAKPYTFDDVVNALNKVAPFDWRKFWEDRVWLITPHAPLAGVESSGWKLIFDENQSELEKATEARAKTDDFTYSLGMVLSSEDGTVEDIVFNSPAATAGMMPGMKLVAVNGRAWSAEILHDALSAAKNNTEPLQLLIENTEYFRTISVDYHGGDRYPHLVPNGKPDLLSDILKQHAAAVP
jgi:predicted metalloprotease with PDZ domain